MSEEKQEQKHSRQAAIIGLAGTVLTVCGGLAGALIGGLTTVYKIEQEAQKLSIAAPQDERPLTVDTRQVTISASQASDLNPSEYLVLDDLEMVMPRPAAGWEDGGQMMYMDLFFEEEVNLSPLILFSAQVGNAWDYQPLRRLRYSQPVMVQFVDGSTENDIPVDVSLLDSDTIAFYSQMTVLALEKAQTPNYTLYDLALRWGHLHRGGVNSIIANPDSRYVFEQVTWQLENVRIEGQRTDLALQRWALFAEGDDHYYIVEVQYVPAVGQSVQVWDDLQNYISSFRVIE